MDDILNEAFIESLDSAEGVKTAALASETFIRQKLREAGFARKILQPEFVSFSEVTAEQYTDECFIMKEIEPDSSAMPVSLRGRADYNYITGQRYKIKFFPISSQKFEKKEEELAIYRMPITKIIESNNVKDIQRVEDGRLITHVNASIAATGNSGTSSYTTGKHGVYVPRDVVTKLMSQLNDKDLELEYILMNKRDWNTISLWEDLGSQLSAEVFPDGYKYDTLNGIKIITTNKSDLVPKGTCYGFANQNFFGNFLVLSDIKFYIKKIDDVVSFFAKENIGMGIGNINGVTKVTVS